MLRNTTVVRMRNYGRIIQDMVKLAVEETDLEKQRSMIIYIAQCMRQKNALWNREQESGVDRLKDDIVSLSNGVLDCNFPEFEEIMLHLSSKPIMVVDRQTAQKKKKK